jgi:hypothetical protein
MHDDLFSEASYTATFYNTTQGTRDNLNDTYSGETRQQIGVLQVEMVPPAIDTTIRDEGTSFSWDTSIRFPLGTDSLTVSDGETYTVASGETEQYATVTIASGGTLVVDGSLLVYESITNNGVLTDNGTVTVFGESDFADTIVPFGEDNRKPTEVEIVDDVDEESEVYQLDGYSIEKGSGMVMARLREK